MATEKKKGGLKSALFGNRPSGEITYRVIYMSLACYVSDKGPEQVAMILYGDDNETIFTVTLPAGAIMYSYKDDIDGPFIKVNKSFMPGSNRAEIWLPKGYSFMAPSVPSIAPVVAPMIATDVAQGVVDAMPKPSTQYIPMPVTNNLCQDTVELPEAEMSTDDVIRLVNENEAKAKADMEERESRGELFEVAAVQPKGEQMKGNVIPESEEFGATFDEDVLNEKINKFLAKNEPKVKVEAKPKTEVDPRTIEEVKRESVEDEMERLMKNDEAMMKIKEAADKDATEKPSGYGAKR